MFSILCDVIFLVGLQGKFEIDHSWEWKAWSPLPVSFSRCDSELTAAGILLGVDYSVVTVQLKFVFLPDISR